MATENNDEPAVVYQGPGYQRVLTNEEPVEAGTPGKKTKKKGKLDTVKFLLPVRISKTKTRSRLDTTGLIGTLLYSFLTPIYRQAKRKGITQETLMPLMSDRDDAARNCARLERFWKEELARKGEEKASLNKAVARFVRTRVLFAALAVVTSLSSGFLLTAYLLYKAVTYLESKDNSTVQSVTLAFGILMSTYIRIIGSHTASYLNYRSAVRLRSAVMLMLYRKVSRLRSASMVSVGEMVNICVNDIQRMHDAVVFGTMLVAFPLFILFIVAGVTFVVGVVPTVVGTSTLLLFFVVQASLAKINVRFRQKCVVFTDRRTRLMNELLNCVKLIKMYAWEESFARNLAGIREDERRYLQRAGVLQTMALGIAVTLGPAVVLTSIVSFVLLGNVVTAAKAFTVMQLYGSLASAFYFMPIALKPISESIVALRRIRPIMLMDESNHEWPHPSNETNAIEIEHASFAWDAPPTTSDVNRNDIPSVTNGGRDTGDTIATNSGPKSDPRAKASTKEPDDSADGLLGEGGTKAEQPQGRLVTLRGINLVVPTRHLIGICGTVGSGKSSILSCLLDQMNLLEGTVALKGSFAYASQQAWITNSTVRDNILFGAPLDEERYRKALFSCCLERDLEIMTDGDQTEIGERGVNVSGGQKQRISLARAYYSNRDIYLLDDPLSAVDAHVGKHIFNHCIHGALVGKTVLFVTHQLQYLSDCDYIVLMKEGSISEQGTHDDLTEAGGEYARLLETYHGRADTDDDSDGRSDDDLLSIHPDDEAFGRLSEDERDRLSTYREDVEDDGDTDEAHEVVKLIGAEDQGVGTVAYVTYKSFVRFAGGKFFAFLIPLLMFLTMMSSITTNVWLSLWIQSTTVWREHLADKPGYNVSTSPLPTPFGSSHSTPPLINSSYSNWSTTANPQAGYDDDDYNSDYYYTAPTDSPGPGGLFGSGSAGIALFIAIYFGIFFTTVFMLASACFIFIKTVLRATTRIHDALLRKIMKCPMAFFDTTPLGRILNRFSKDMDEVDLMLPINLQRCLLFLSIVFLQQIIIIFVFPYYLIAFVTCLILSLVLYSLFRRGYVEIKRMENTSRSKVVSHISATMQGLATIKAYGQGERFAQRFEYLLNRNSLIMEIFSMAPRWVGIRMDLMASTLMFIIAISILIYKDDLVSAALAAMALQMAIQLSGGLLQEVLLSCTQTESSFLSVERMMEYIQQTPSEAESHIEATKPDEGWPEKGDLKFRRLEMRYRPRLPLILKGVTCHIRAKEKVGIVGRTGSGKSTLGVSLFRLVENASGKILLDGVDISTVGLHDLRSKLSIIPQDPVLFAGTIRFNLDPLNNHTDVELWAALENTYIKPTISALDNQLEALVIENGENFSVGERQLICMARALLRNSKVLLMDEATAAIDTETDSLIQQTIRQAFQDCTILIIAHRLNTVLDCDKIMVLDKGEISEFDRPENLREDPNSQFSGMLAAAEQNKGSLEE